MKRKSSKKTAAAAALLLAAIIVTTIMFSLSNRPKTSVVVSEYDGTPTDGCMGYKLKDGRDIVTFCFWSGPEVEVQGPIEVGDTVEYDLSAKHPFIRVKK